MKDGGPLLGEKGRDEEERRSADAKRRNDATGRAARRTDEVSTRGGNEGQLPSLGKRACTSKAGTHILKVRQVVPVELLLQAVGDVGENDQSTATTKRSATDLLLVRPPGK